MRALVLGGGGVVGLAWEAGIVAGLLDEGVDLREADAIVGTSAGSLMGTRLAAGQDVRQAEHRTSVAVPMPEGGPDLDVLRDVFARWSTAARVDREFLLDIGALAGRARTAGEADWVAATGGSVGVASWPGDQLRVIAVDIDNAALVAFSRSSGAELARAIAASCAIPGMFPPITINGRRYMDGGVRSGTSADVLLPDRPCAVVVIAPIVTGTAGFGALAERCLDAEVTALEAAGCRVTRILPLAEEKQAFGNNLMDPSAAAAARAAGESHGRSIAADVERCWRDA